MLKAGGTQATLPWWTTQLVQDPSLEGPDRPLIVLWENKMSRFRIESWLRYDVLAELYLQALVFRAAILSILFDRTQPVLRALCGVGF